MISWLLRADKQLFRRIGAMRHRALLGSMRALLLASAIGVSRIYLGAHYPLDVAVGAVLGCGCGALARLIAP